MAARIAHEINNPLAGIENSFHLIRDAVPEDHPDRDMVERIDREIARISNIVQQMYKLYSPKVGRTASVVVGDAIRDVLSMLEPLRRESEVEFDTTGVLPGLSVLVHDGGVQQIVYNLITNAIKASPPGGVICVSAGLDHRRANVVQIGVHDGGKAFHPTSSRGFLNLSSAYRPIIILRRGLAWASRSSRASSKWRMEKSILKVPPERGLLSACFSLGSRK